MLGPNVRLYRDGLGWTQQKLAEMSGLSRTQINKIEKGVNKGSSFHVRSCLAKAFDMTVDEFSLFADSDPGLYVCRFLTPPGLAGWGCCNCKSFNSIQRADCHHCKHRRCSNQLERKAMKGNNTIIMNQLSLIEAIQEYFDKRWSGPEQKIVAVMAASDSRPDSLTVQILVSAKEYNE